METANLIIIIGVSIAVIGGVIMLVCSFLTGGTDRAVSWSVASLSGVGGGGITGLTIGLLETGIPAFFFPLLGPFLAKILLVVIGAIVSAVIGKWTADAMQPHQWVGLITQIVGTVMAVAGFVVQMIDRTEDPLPHRLEASKASVAADWQRTFE